MISKRIYIFQLQRGFQLEIAFCTIADNKMQLGIYLFAQRFEQLVAQQDTARSRNTDNEPRRVCLID